MTEKIKVKSRSKVLYIVLTAIMSGVIAVLVFIGGIAFPLMPGVTALYPATVPMVLFPIWFGVWGLAANYIGAVIGSTLHGGSLVLNLVLGGPTDIIVGLPGLILFKLTKANAALKTKKDWIVWIVVCFVTPFGSSFLYLTAIYYIGWIPSVSALWLAYAAWWIDEWLLLFILGTIFAKAATDPLRRLGLFVEGWY